MTPKILVFAGSTRTGAFSGKTADIAQKELALLGAEVTRISLADYPLPIVDQDLEAAEGIPENAYKLARLLIAHDGVLIATPEYNGSVPPLLKNALDWVSRIRTDNGKKVKPFDAKVMALCGSSNGRWGGIRAVQHLRQILTHMGVDLISPQCLVPDAGSAFDESGNFTEERSLKSMQGVCKTLIDHAWLLSGQSRGER
jgi:chromate reductase